MEQPMPRRRLRGRRQGERPAGERPAREAVSRKTLFPLQSSTAPSGPVLCFYDPSAAPEGDFVANAIPNGRLQASDVPPSGALWESVEEFALTYDGYAYWSDVSELATRALQEWTHDGSLPGDLDSLRGCLFYEERRWHHFGAEPDGRAARYVGALLDAIARALVPAADAG